MKRYSLAIFCLILLAGCGGANSLASEANFKKIQLKMSSEKVTELVGSPTKQQKHSQFPSIEIWEYGDVSHVTFDNQKVTAVKYHDTMLVEEELPDDE